MIKHFKPPEVCMCAWLRVSWFSRQPFLSAASLVVGIIPHYMRDVCVFDCLSDCSVTNVCYIVLRLIVRIISYHMRDVCVFDCRSDGSVTDVCHNVLRLIVRISEWVLYSYVSVWKSFPGVSVRNSCDTTVRLI